MNTYISASAWPSHLLCPSLNHKKVASFTQIRPDHITVCAYVSLKVFVGVMFLDFDCHCSGPWTEWKFGEWTFWVSN